MDSLNKQDHCPKCQAPLPEGSYSRSDGVCPRCGLVFAKYRAAQERISREQTLDRQDTSETRSHTVSELLLSVPDTISRWRFYTGMIGWFLFVIWGWQIAQLDYRSGAINQSFLHGPLLVFHEAGHVIFRLFGHFLMVLGGSLAQLLMPLVLLIALLRTNRDPLGASLALWLLGISLLDVAPYIYDALHPQIILLNGATGEEGGHDWIYILSEIGWLQKAQTIGRLVYLLGIATILISAIWSALLLTKQWKKITPN